MKSDEKVALVPKLRFPEFRGADVWKARTLGSIASFASGGTPSKDNPEYWNGSIPWVSASSMYDLVVEKTDHYVTPLAIGNGTRIAKKGSVLILVRGSMLFNRVPICIAGVDLAFNQDVKALDVEASVDTHFILYQLLSFQSRFTINETGIGAGKIELDHLKEFALFVPGKTEQQKIAKCLSSVDEVIAAQSRKVDALKTHKKGLMQQLFPREGETQPRLRFPEFREVEGWSGEVLEDLLAMPATYGIVTAGEFQETGVPMVRGGDIKAGRVGDGLPLVTEEVHFQYRRTILQANDIVIALVGYPGEAAVIPQHYVGANISRAVGLLRLKDVQSSHYLACYLNSPVGRKTVLKPSAGSAQIVVNLKHLNALVVPVPKPAEQHRIASCLSSIDALIVAETQKLAGLKQHKRGLMQQIFPSPENAQA